MTQAVLTQAVDDLSIDLRTVACALPALAVFDSRVDDLDQLIAGLLPGIEAIVLHPHEDGVAQLAALLATRRGLRQLHLVGHGEPGRLWLGLGAIDAVALRGVDWHKAFANGAEVVVYGCESGAGTAGRDLVAALHEATGAAVAASQSAVGQGCWTLDVATGP